MITVLNIPLQVSRIIFVSPDGSWQAVLTQCVDHGAENFQDNINGNCSWSYKTLHQNCGGMWRILCKPGPPSNSFYGSSSRFFTYGLLAFRIGLRELCRMLWYQVPVSLATNKTRAFHPFSLPHHPCTTGVKPFSLLFLFGCLWLFVLSFIFL